MTAADQGAGAPPPPPPQGGSSPAQTAPPAAAIPPWEIVTLVSGVVMLIASFLPFYTIELAGLAPGVPEDVVNDKTMSAWSNNLSLFPMATITCLLVVAAVAQVAVSRFAKDVSIPDRVGGLDWNGIRILLGGLATLTMLAYLLRGGSDFDVSKGIGLILALLASIGLVVGAFMERSEAGAGQQGSSPIARRPPTTGDIVLMASGAAILVCSFLHVIEDRSAWGGFLFPLFTLPALLGAALAIRTALAAFADVRIPDRVLGIAWREIDLGVAGWALLMMLSLLIGRMFFEIEAGDFDVDGSDKDVLQEFIDDNQVEQPGRSFGFWGMLISSIGVMAGAYLRSQESGDSVPPGPPVPQQAPPPPPPPA